MTEALRKRYPDVPVGVLPVDRTELDKPDPLAGVRRMAQRQGFDIQIGRRVMPLEARGASFNLVKGEDGKQRLFKSFDSSFEALKDQPKRKDFADDKSFNVAYGSWLHSLSEPDRRKLSQLWAGKMYAHFLTEILPQCKTLPDRAAELQCKYKVERMIDEPECDEVAELIKHCLWAKAVAAEGERQRKDAEAKLPDILSKVEEDFARGQLRLPVETGGRPGLNSDPRYMDPKDLFSVKRSDVEFDLPTEVFRMPPKRK